MVLGWGLDGALDMKGAGKFVILNTMVGHIPHNEDYTIEVNKYPDRYVLGQLRLDSAA